MGRLTNWPSPLLPSFLLGGQNYLGHSKRNERNYYIYANLAPSPVCMVDDSPDAQDTFINNTCVHEVRPLPAWSTAAAASGCLGVLFLCVVVFRVVGTQADSTF